VGDTTHLVPRFGETRQTRQHIFHIIETRRIVTIAPGQPFIRQRLVPDSPVSKSGMFVSESIKVDHQLVNRFLHVHMPDFRPYRIFFIQQCFLLLDSAQGGLYFIPVNAER
jgi:hypothetical protein